MQFLHLLCFSINTIFSSKVNLNCNVFTYSSCWSFINWAHCHQLALCVSNISFWFNTGKRQATIISSPSSELFRLNFTTKQFSRFGNKKRICPSFVFFPVRVLAHEKWHAIPMSYVLTWSTMHFYAEVILDIYIIEHVHQVVFFY